MGANDIPFPNCNCPGGILTVFRTVRKEGPNIGRTFFACEKPQDGGSCGYFQWTDEPPRAGPNSGQDSGGMGFGGGGANAAQGGGYNGPCPQCQCVPAVSAYIS